MKCLKYIVIDVKNMKIKNKNENVWCISNDSAFLSTYCAVCEMNKKWVSWWKNGALSDG